MTTDETFVEELGDRTVEAAHIALVEADIQPVNRTIRAYVEGWVTSVKSSACAVGMIKVCVDDDGDGPPRVRTRVDIHSYTPHLMVPVVTAVHTRVAIATGLDGETAQAFMLGWGRGLVERKGGI